MGVALFRSGKLSNPPLTPPLIRGENHYRFKCYAALVAGDSFERAARLDPHNRFAVSNLATARLLCGEACNKN